MPVTGTQCNLYFVTDDPELGLFLVAAGHEKIVVRGKVRQVTNRKEEGGNVKSKPSGWERSVGIMVEM